MTNNGEDVVSSESTQALIDKYGTKPPPPNNPEFDAEKMTEAIKNWWTQTGEVYWNKQLSKIYDELEKSIQAYNKETGSNVPLPPIPETFPKDPVPATPIEVSPKSAKDAMADLEVAASDPTKSGDAIWRIQNRAIEAQVFEGMQIGIVRNMTNRMYDEHFGSQEDKEAHRNVNSIFGAALSSGDTGEREDAIRFADVFNSLTDKKIIEEYNKTDKWNALGAAKDIGELISILQKILEATKDNGQVDLTIEEISL
jgi:hypothetical protein